MGDSSVTCRGFGSASDTTKKKLRFNNRVYSDSLSHVEHLLRCGIDTSTCIVFIIIIYYSTNSLSRTTAHPRNRTVPAGPRSSPNNLLRLRERALYPHHDFSIAQKGWVSPITRKEEANTRPETSASLTRASTTVTGTLHTHFSVDPTISRTLPDLANVPPGLYCSACEVCRTDPLLSKITNTDHSHVLMHDL